jgi:hypothetical protein
LRSSVSGGRVDAMPSSTNQSNQLLLLFQTSPSREERKNMTQVILTSTSRSENKTQKLSEKKSIRAGDWQSCAFKHPGENKSHENDSRVAIVVSGSFLAKNVSAKVDDEFFSRFPPKCLSDGCT